MAETHRAAERDSMKDAASVDRIASTVSTPALAALARLTTKNCRREFTRKERPFTDAIMDSTSKKLLYRRSVVQKQLGSSSQFSWLSGADNRWRTDGRTDGQTDEG